MAALNRVSWLGMIVTLATSPQNRIAWLLLLFALGVSCYITQVSEPPAGKKKVPARGGIPDKHKR